MRRQVINYKGKTFYTYTALTRYYNVSLTTFNKRKREYPDLGLDYWITGVTTPDAIDKITKKYDIVYNGKGYKNYAVLCKTLGLNYRTVLERKKNYPDLGLDYWITGNKPEGYKKTKNNNTKSTNKINYKGTQFGSYTELCAHYKVSIKTFEARKYKYPQAPLDYWIFGEKSGYNPLQELKSKLNLTYRGKKYKSIEDMCEAYNVTPSFFEARFYTNPKKGLDFYLNADDNNINTKEVKYNGIWYKSYKDLVDVLGINGFYTRRNKHPNLGLDYWVRGF